LEFEEFLAGLFRAQGYAAELTPTSGDYGADLILSKEGQRIAVQAKRYVGSVGVQAVQEALSGQAYYQCHTAWVISTGVFTTNALELAEKSGVRMIGRSDLGNLMAQHTAESKNG
jgi:restriction system protein